MAANSQNDCLRASRRLAEGGERTQKAAAKGGSKVCAATVFTHDASISLKRCEIRAGEPPVFAIPSTALSIVTGLRANNDTSANCIPWSARSHIQAAVFCNTPCSAFCTLNDTYSVFRDLQAGVLEATPVIAHPPPSPP